MYLKKLELLGFKSFKNKTRLEFDKGITAVVGPNGSGKSNVSDAIRWVLGEQSAKNLRGSKMEDIIFSGTLNKKPLGFASVSMFMDNSERILAIPYEEIIITRKLYRSGESEFQINGTQCRLKDIHQLFMDTGIGREGYSIIGQGSIEEILSSKNEDRRKIFEEATGIIKYKSRRDEVFTKLEKEKQNLVRVRDIIAELESKLPILYSQSEKAKKYLSIAEEIKLLKVNIFLVEEKKVSEEIEKVKKDFFNLEKQLQEEHEKKDDFQKFLEDYKSKAVSVDKDIELHNTEITDIKLKVEQKESSTMVISEQIKNILSEVNRLKDEIAKKQNDVSKNKNECSQLNIGSDNLKDEILNSNNMLKLTENELETIIQNISKVENEIKKFNEYIIKNITAINEIKSAINQTHLFLDQIKKKEEKIKLEIEDNKKIVSASNINIKGLIDKSNDIKEKILLNEKQMQDISQKKIYVEEKLSKYVSNLTTTTKNINDIKSRLNILVELEENYEGYHRGVKSVLKFKKNNPNKLKGIIDVVGEIIDVPKYLETAIEVSFGSSIQNIITYTEEDAQEAISILKSLKGGRATFLPVSSIKKRNININIAALDSSSVIGIARDLISYDLKFENIISSLIGNIIIVDDIKNAVYISKKSNYLYKIVTLQGELINPSGAITGGTLNKNIKVLGRSKEIQESKSKIKLLQQEEKNLSDKIHSIEGDLKYSIKALENSKKLLHEYDLENLKVTQDIKQEKMILETLLKNKDSFNRELESINEEIFMRTEDIKKFEEKDRSLEKDKNNIENELLKYQQSLSKYQNEKELIIQKITDIKINIMSIEQKLNFNIKSIEDVNILISNYKLEIEESQSEINKFLDNKESKTKILKETQLEIIELRKLQSKKIEKLKLLSIEKDNVISKYDKIQIDERQELELISDLRTEEARLKIKIENLEAKKLTLYNEIWEEYELTYQKALKYMNLEKSLEEMRKLEKQFKEEIKSLGNINLESIEEYKQVKKRCNFLIQQKLDIEEAEEKLKDIIVEFTKLMEDQFFSQFNIISENFSMVFKEIFGGGTAYLKLSSQDNVLESGIDIVAQPPGKKLQSMSLMSGGEKSLTAIALLFSILHMKPSPFCVLDEIEAALDDVNIGKFANYLDNLSSNTQFILITHKKGTMEIANNIYGVTMEEEGISKLLSINLN